MSVNRTTSDNIPQQHVDNLPQTPPVLQKGLLLLSVAFGALSLIPPFRFAGSLATRSVAFLSTSSLSCDSWSKSNALGRLMSCTKLAAVTVGLVGVAVGSPLLVIASLAADLGIQTINAASNLYKGNVGKSLINQSMMVINALALSAMIVGSWPLMVAAAAISAVAMAAIAIKVAVEAKDKGDAFEAICYGALAVLGAASAMSVAERYSYTATKAHFWIKNNRDTLVTFYGRGGQIVGQVRPGELKELIVPVEQCGISILGGPNSTIPFGDYMIRSSPLTKGLGVGISADNYTYTSNLIHPALPVDQFPTVPVTGTVIATKEFA